MDFDFDKWNASINKVQSFKPGTPQWNRRIKDDMEKAKLNTPLPDYLKSYEDKKEKENKDGGCFITTACIKSRGLDDNCYELNMLRNFRDDYFRIIPNGQNVIYEYYNIAPKIVSSINNKRNSEEIYNVIYEKMILPVIELIKKNHIDDAYRLSKMYYNNLKKTFL